MRRGEEGEGGGEREQREGGGCEEGGEGKR